MSRSSIIHPNITSIIRVRDQIETALYSLPIAPEAVVNMMAGLVSKLEPTDIDEIKDTFKYINEEIEALAKKRSLALKNQRIKLRLHVYKQWFLLINKILWDKDYLKHDKYGQALNINKLDFDEVGPQ